MSAFGKYVYAHIIIFVILITVMVSGVIFGSFAANKIDEIQKNEIFKYVNNFFTGSKINISQIALFWQIFIGYTKIILVYWFLGITVIGVPFIILLIGFNGFCIGFSVGFMLKYFFTIKGICMVIYSVLPQGFILIPSILILSVSGIQFSMQLLKEKTQIKLGFVKHSITAIVIIVMLGVLALIESFLLKTIT